MNLPKNGDHQHCDNWRGITLLSVPRKIFCRVLLNRIDVKLCQEQAGYRRGKGCTNQILALCNIIEQSIECNAPLCIGFIVFKKAFDSTVHYGKYWDTMDYHRALYISSAFYIRTLNAVH